MDLALPPLPRKEWLATQETLHRWAQVVGKIRLSLAPPRDHWWHVSLRPSPLGLSTQMIPVPGGAFEIEFDFVTHGLDVRTSAGDRCRIPLRDGLSVAAFHDGLLRRLAEFGIRPKIRAVSYDLEPRIPFARDRVHATYDPEAVARFATILRFVAGAFEEFAGRFRGKSSPVHFFWHSFDLAVTRFSGRAAPAVPGQTAVEREAYSDQVASFGFWPGDDDVPRPSFYAYAAPEPQGLTKQRLRPRSARWLPEGGMALLPYDVVRKSRDPKATLLEFLECAFQAARSCADWDGAVAPKVASAGARRGT